MKKKNGSKDGTNRFAVLERQIRSMTNSHKPQSEKLATGGGRETTAEKPDNNVGRGRDTLRERHM